MRGGKCQWIDLAVTPIFPNARFWRPNCPEARHRRRPRLLKRQNAILRPRLPLSYIIPLEGFVQRALFRDEALLASKRTGAVPVNGCLPSKKSVWEKAFKNFEEKVKRYSVWFSREDFMSANERKVLYPIPPLSLPNFQPGYHTSPEQPPDLKICARTTSINPLAQSRTKAVNNGF
ncbi:hypothetical protein NPIL_312311 [Nephila pilipes]|uniref:Uncharacterized protein n=1 Tax=Nephila pilipes TaxID=299642 RepID=A0A8X6NRF3_NEPPI|nr:hypothetical protein NPIL_312311 [Nephila pilipes]